MATTETTTRETETMNPDANRKSWTAAFEDGSGARLDVRLERRKDGWRTYVRHRSPGKGKSKGQLSRGATETHAAEQSARAVFEKAQVAARRAGWKRRETRGGFATKPDAFDLSSLPKPAKK